MAKGADRAKEPLKYVDFFGRFSAKLDLEAGSAVGTPILVPDFCLIVWLHHDYSLNSHPPIIGGRAGRWLGMEGADEPSSGGGKVESGRLARGNEESTVRRV